MVEYALIIALVAVISVVVVGVIGGETANAFDAVSTGLGGESLNTSKTTTPAVTTTTVAAAAHDGPPNCIGPDHRPSGC